MQEKTNKKKRITQNGIHLTSNETTYNTSVVKNETSGNGIRDLTEPSSGVCCTCSRTTLCKTLKCKFRASKGHVDHHVDVIPPNAPTEMSPYLPRKKNLPIWINLRKLKPKKKRPTELCTNRAVTLVVMEFFFSFS